MSGGVPAGAGAARDDTEYAVSADGTRIAFERTGSGPVVVLVDGALVQREVGPARPLAGALASRFTAVAYDRRGRGLSGDTAPYAVEREVEDLRAVIEAVGGDAAVVAQSSGAVLALRAAAAGVPMRALVVYEAPWTAPRRRRDAGADHLHELRTRLEAGRPGGAVDYFMVHMAGAPWFVPFMLRLSRDAWTHLQAAAPTLPYDAQLVGPHPAPPVDLLRQVTVPTFVLAGARSPQPMRDTQRAVAAAIPGAQHGELLGQTHQVQPHILAPLVIAFLGRAGTEGAGPAPRDGSTGD